jgi:UDP-glucose 4-epimerase
VTGGAGFIGSNLVEILLDSGEEVTILDNLHTGSLNNLVGLKGALKIVQANCGDILNLDLRPEAIYHLGIPSSSPMYKRDPFLVGNAINEAISVFELAKKFRCKVVYASSSSLYNGLNPPHREDMQVLVTDYYTEARLAIERIAELYKQLFDVNSVGMRFFSVYGPKEMAKKQYANMVSQFLWEMQAGGSPMIFGDGSQTRDFVYVKDVVRALCLAMDSNYHGILNVGMGISYSFNEIIEMLNSMLGLTVKPKYVANPVKNYVQHTLADTSKCKDILKFEAKFNLEEGLGKIIEYYRTSKHDCCDLFNDH